MADFCLMHRSIMAHCHKTVLNGKIRPVLAVGAQEANVSYASRCGHSVPAI
jgi:hypothetical protein